MEHLTWLLLGLINPKDTSVVSFGFILVSLLLILNIFHSFFYRIHTSLWAGKRRLRSEHVYFLPTEKSYLSSNKN